MNVRIALDVPEGYAYIGMVRQIGRMLLEHHRTAAQDIDDVETIVGELCGNVTRHARSESGCYQVILEHHDSHLVVLVADQGQGFDPADVPPVGEQRPGADGALRYGGFGLHLVRTLADRLDIGPSQSQGTRVRAEKKLTYPVQLPAGN